MSGINVAVGNDSETDLSCSDHEEYADAIQGDSNTDQPKRKKCRTEANDSQTVTNQLQEQCATTEWQVEEVCSKTDISEGDVKTDSVTIDTSGTAMVRQVGLVKDVIVIANAFHAGYPELEKKCHWKILKTIRNTLLFVAGGKFIHTGAALKESFYKNFSQELLDSIFPELKVSLEACFEIGIREDNGRPKFAGDDYEREIKKMQHRLNVISERQRQFQNGLDDLRRTFVNYKLTGTNSSADKILSLLESIRLCNM